MVSKYISDFQNIVEFKKFFNKEIDTLTEQFNKKNIKDKKLGVKLNVLMETLKNMKTKPILEDKDIEVLLSTYDLINIYNKL